MVHDQVVLTPYKAERNHPLTDAQKTANTVLNGLRRAVETGFATLKTWRVLDKPRLHSRHATTLIRALLVLIQHEQHNRDLTTPHPPRPLTHSVNPDPPAKTRMKNARWGLDRHRVEKGRSPQG